MIFDELIWDRTEADADRAAYLSRLGPNMTASERTEWNAGLRGAYNYTDWNRVEEAVETLAAPLEITVTTKTDWDGEDVWTLADEARYIANLRAVTEDSALIPGTLVGLSIDRANAIEAAVWIYATGLLWAQDGPVYAADGLLRVMKQEAI